MAIIGSCEIMIEKTRDVGITGTSDGFRIMMTKGEDVFFKDFYWEIDPETCFILEKLKKALETKKA